MSDSNTEKWQDIVNEDAASAGAAPTATVAASAPAAAYATIPELPEVIGRVPVKGNPSYVIVELPQPYAGVACAAVFHNVTELVDCTRPKRSCRPASKSARPLNDRQIEVELWDGDGTTISGPGWKESGYPGGQLETRPAQTGIPYVEIKLVAGRTITCGPCDPDNYAPEYG